VRDRSGRLFEGVGSSAPTSFPPSLIAEVAGLAGPWARGNANKVKHKNGDPIVVTR
jgi:hypothetical protein